MKTELILGFLVVLLAAVWMILLSLRKQRGAGQAVFRRIPAIARLRGAVGLSVEDGSRVHVSLGNGDLNDAANPSALAGLDALHRVGQLSATSDQPSVCTSGNGGFAVLSKDVLSQAARETNTLDAYDPDHGYLSGVTPLAYTLGAMEVMSEPGVKTNVFTGSFGPEAGFLTTASEERGAFTLAGSESIIAQSVFMATARDVILGEELYVLPAYLVQRASYIASLKVQDFLRILLGGALVIGALLKLAGIL